MLSARNGVVSVECSPELVAVLTERWSVPVQVKIVDGRFISRPAPSLLTAAQRDALEAYSTGTDRSEDVRIVHDLFADMGVVECNGRDIARWLLADATIRGGAA